MTHEQIPYLSAEQLSALHITTQDAIKSIETVIHCVEAGSALHAPKAVLLPEDGRYMMATLAAVDEPAILAVKTLVLNPRNPDCGLPQINGLVTLLDSKTGLPLAILDGNWITAIRTAGLSATAAQRMAKKDSSVVALIGCGTQARSHLQAFCDLFPLREVRLFGRGQTNIDRLCKNAANRNLSAIVCDSGEEAVTGADLIVSSVTYSADLPPFLNANWLKPGSFSAITDLAAPWNQNSFSALDQIVIDDLEQEAAHPNKLAPPEWITGDLSGLVTGRFAGRDLNSDRNAFIFRGHAIGDLALSVLAYQKHRMEGSTVEKSG